MNKDTSSILYDELVEKYKVYNSNDADGLDLIQKSFNFAQIVFYNETRFSGIPFLDHCLSTAILCCDYKVDSTTIAAAILHDSYTFGAKREEIIKETSVQVADMLDNLEKIKTIRNNFKGSEFSKAAYYNDYLRRLIVVLGKDIRVVILRLCEKYDSLKDVESLPLDKRTNVINNIFDVYAPLAELLGFNILKKQMENLAFEKQNPQEFTEFRKIIKNQKTTSNRKFIEFERNLKRELTLNNISYSKVYGRVKSEYSLYKKMLRKLSQYDNDRNKTIESIKDKTAFTVLTENETDCYRIFATIDALFRVDKDSTDDYIKNPKTNGYRSIHMIVDIGQEDFIEVQIKTTEMNEFNEYGAASHSYYKLYGSEVVKQEKIDFLKNIVAWKDSLDDKSKSFEITNETILTFTPKGEVIELPNESTPIDFAYHVHSKIGEAAVSAKVNGKMVSLTYILNSGDLVEIITSKNIKRTNYYDLLKHVKTKEAKLALKKRMRRK